MVKYLIAWFVMLLVSVGNGIVRDLTYARHMDVLTAHQVSTGVSLVLLGMVIWVFLRRYPSASGRQALVTGLFWMTLTVTFEFVFFHYVGGHSWPELLDNYDVFSGRIWVLVLLWIALTPYAYFRLHRRHR